MKKVYLVSYDLDKPGQDYKPLIAYLRSVGAIEILRSDWLLSTTVDAAGIRDDLTRFLDSNDRIMVVALTGESAWWNLLASHEKVKEVLAA